MKINFDVNCNNNQTFKQSVRTATVSRGAGIDIIDPWGTAANFSPSALMGRYSLYSPMRGEVIPLGWRKVEDKKLDESGLKPSELFKMKDEPYLKFIPSPAERLDDLNSAVDYWFAVIEKPGNAAEFAAMCLRNEQKSAVASQLANRVTSNLDLKIDFKQTDRNRANVNRELDAQYGALFEYFNSESDATSRLGVRRPAYIRSESEYLELLKEKNPEEYALEKARIDKKKQNASATKRLALDSMNQARPSENALIQGRVTNRKLDRVGFEILKVNHPIMTGDQYDEDGIGFRIIEPPSEDELIEMKEAALKEQYQREYEEAKEKWLKWKAKPLSYRLSNPSERPPRPKLQLTPMQERELAERNAMYYPPLGSRMIEEDFN